MPPPSLVEGRTRTRASTRARSSPVPPPPRRRGRGGPTGSGRTPDAGTAARRWRPRRGRPTPVRPAATHPRGSASSPVASVQPPSGAGTTAVGEEHQVDNEVDHHPDGGVDRQPLLPVPTVAVAPVGHDGPPVPSLSGNAPLRRYYRSRGVRGLRRRSLQQRQAEDGERLEMTPVEGDQGKPVRGRASRDPQVVVGNRPANRLRVG